ncbi:sugar ABC transporter permease [Acholeplasma sp. OttesenSCG-928-E16]|nr:sugar ABC transporter permease [Acholeplasma sp. OttesenSCG-928-E16]
MTNSNVVQSPKKKSASIKGAKIRGTIILHTILVILAVIWLFPILWMVLTAFRAEYNDAGVFVGLVNGSYFPKSYGFDNFVRLFQGVSGTKYSNGYFLQWFSNTLIIAIFTCILSTILNLSVAYIMSKMRFKLRKPFLNIAMILGLFPGFMSIIAIYNILKIFGLLNSYPGSLTALILCYSGGAGLGFYVAKGFFDVVPNSLLESAKLDGATNLQSFTRIVLPLSKPIIVYTALTSFLGPWTDFVFARAILGEQNPERLTVSVGLYSMMYGEQSDANLFSTFVAGCLLVSVPIVTLFLFLQKYYVEGITAGAVKG